MHVVTDASTLNSPVEESDVAAKDDEDDEGLNVRHTDADASRLTVTPRWPTRVFAIECMRKVMAVCDGNENHFCLATAKALRHSGKGQSSLIVYQSEALRHSGKGQSCLIILCPMCYRWLDVKSCAVCGVKA